jgi:hypothetical protein
MTMTKMTEMLMPREVSRLLDTPKKGHRAMKRISRMLATTVAPKKSRKYLQASLILSTLLYLGLLAVLVPTQDRREQREGYESARE